MKKTFTLLLALVLVGALQAQSYKVLGIYKNGEISQTIKLSDIDSMKVFEVGNEEPDTPVIPDEPDNPVIPDDPADTHEYVDLGLPSGTLWATCNVGADSPADYGDYFAWGETEPKEVYDWSTYKWRKGSYDTLTKYCTKSSYGTVDNKTELEPADDAATANWGSNWCMPTKAQQDELRNTSYVTWIWTKMTTSNGASVSGYKIVSKSNGNSIFLPAAGYRGGSNLSGAGSWGYYWSSSLRSVDPYYAYSLYFDSDSICRNDDGRYFGQSVRPVRASAR